MQQTDPAHNNQDKSPEERLTFGESNFISAAQELKRNYPYNFLVNVLDGSFFGAALGFASFVTVIPLFVSSLTDSAVLIGLIPAIHAVGWQLPQLLTAQKVSRLQVYKPIVLILTVHERLPFFGLAILAWFHPGLDHRWVLVLTFVLLIWQGFGGGFTATAWQSMIGKIIPSDRLGVFFGVQSASAYLLASLAAIVAGVMLERLGSPLDFTACFLLAGVAMGISWIFLSWTREPKVEPVGSPADGRAFWGKLGAILRQDGNFRWFLAARMLSQLAVMAFAFYTVFVVRIHGVSVSTVGLMTGMLMATQIIANPVMGWLGDHYGHRLVLEIGIGAAIVSASLAWLGTNITWFYLVFALAGVANVAMWTIPIAMTLEFGREGEKPAYIGLANTLIAPSTILAPLLGGWLADTTGYPSAFLLSAVAGILTVYILHTAVKDPRQRIQHRHVVTESE